MPRMPDIEAEARAAVGWFTHITHQAPAQPETAAPAAPNQEDHMSLLEIVHTAVADVEAKLEGIDEEAVKIVKAIQAHPETAPFLSTLASLAGLPIPAGSITKFGQSLLGLLELYAPEPAPAAPAPAQ